MLGSRVGDSCAERRGRGHRGQALCGEEAAGAAPLCGVGPPTPRAAGLDRTAPAPSWHSTEVADTGRVPGARRLQGVRGPPALGPTFHFLTVSVPRHSCVVIGDHVHEGLGAFLGGRPASLQRNHQQVSCLAWTRLAAARASLVTFTLFSSLQRWLRDPLEGCSSRRRCRPRMARGFLPGDRGSGPSGWAEPLLSCRQSVLLHGSCQLRREGGTSPLAVLSVSAAPGRASLGLCAPGSTVACTVGDQ